MYLCVGVKAYIKNDIIQYNINNIMEFIYMFLYVIFWGFWSTFVRHNPNILKSFKLGKKKGKNQMTSAFGQSWRGQTGIRTSNEELSGGCTAAKTPVKTNKTGAAKG